MSDQCDEDGVVDYHKFTTITTTQSERRRLGVGDLFINEATCNKCNDTVRSRNRHDCRTCKCGSLSVDGGSWYSRRRFSSERDYEGFTDNTVYFNNVVTKPREQCNNTDEHKVD